MNSYNVLREREYANSDQFNKRSYLIIYELLYVFFAFLGNRFSRTFLFLSIGIAIWTIIRSEKEDIFYFSMFIIPAVRIFDSIGVTYVVNLLLVLVIIVFLIKVRKIKSTLLFVVLLIIYEAFHMFCYSDFLTLVENIASIFGIFLGFTVSSDNNLKISTEKTASNIMRGVVLSSLCYLLLNPSFLNNWYNNLGSEIWRFSSFSGDPNALAVYALLAVALYISSKTISEKYIPILVLSLIVIMTFSKMGIILLLANIIALFVLHKNESKQVILVLLLPFIIIGIMLFFSDFITNLYGGFLERFFRGDVSASLNTLTSGRFDIDVMHFKYIFERPIFLLFGESMNYAFYSGINHVAHNTYFDILFSWGLVGIALIFILMHYWMRYSIPHNVKREKKQYLPLLTLMGAFLSLSFFSASMLWFVVAASFVSLRDNEVVSNGKI